MANLQRASLTEANLERAQLFGANLRGADLFWARLQGAGLSEGGPDYVQTNLQAADLFEANLQGTDLGGARLHGANLTGAKMQGSYLFGLQLQGANINGTQFQGASCECEGDKSDLFSFSRRISRSIDRESDLSSVVFSGGLHQEELDTLVSVCSDEKADNIRQMLAPHVGKPASNEVPGNIAAITGTYSKRDAEIWIAEYTSESISIVHEDDRGDRL